MFKNVAFDVRAQLKTRKGCGGSSVGKIAYHQARRPEFDPKNHMVEGGNILFALLHTHTQVKRTNVKRRKNNKKEWREAGGGVVEDTLNAGRSVNSSYDLAMCTPTMGRQQRAVSE